MFESTLSSFGAFLNLEKEVRMKELVYFLLNFFIYHFSFSI